MTVVLNESLDAVHYQVNAINESIVTLCYVNASGRRVFSETHYTLLRAPTKEQLTCI